METLKRNLINLFVGVIASLYIISAEAQSINNQNLVVVNLDAISIVSNQDKFKNMVSKIVSNGSFRYRKALRHSKSVNKQYDFRNVHISEVEILKLFKKAARKSGSPEEFKDYFFDRNLYFLNMLEGYVVSSLYNTIRKTTFNGILDDWQSYH